MRTLSGPPRTLLASPESGVRTVTRIRALGEFHVRRVGTRDDPLCLTAEQFRHDVPSLSARDHQHRTAECPYPIFGPGPRIPSPHRGRAGLWGIPLSGAGPIATTFQPRKAPQPRWGTNSETANRFGV